MKPTNLFFRYQASFQAGLLFTLGLASASGVIAGDSLDPLKSAQYAIHLKSGEIYELDRDEIEDDIESGDEVTLKNKRTGEKDDVNVSELLAESACFRNEVCKGMELTSQNGVRYQVLQVFSHSDITSYGRMVTRQKSTGIVEVQKLNDKVVAAYEVTQGPATVVASVDRPAASRPGQSLDTDSDKGASDGPVFVPRVSVDVTSEAPVQQQQQTSKPPVQQPQPTQPTCPPVAQQPCPGTCQPACPPPPPPPPPCHNPCPQPCQNPCAATCDDYSDEMTEAADRALRRADSALERSRAMRERHERSREMREEARYSRQTVVVNTSVSYRTYGGGYYAFYVGYPRSVPACYLWQTNGAFWMTTPVYCPWQ
jgi:hypothetical protein